MIKQLVENEPIRKYPTENIGVEFKHNTLYFLVDKKDNEPYIMRYTFNYGLNEECGFVKVSLLDGSAKVMKADFIKDILNYYDVYALEDIAGEHEIPRFNINDLKKMYADLLKNAIYEDEECFTPDFDGDDDQ